MASRGLNRNPQQVDEDFLVVKTGGSVEDRLVGIDSEQEFKRAYTFWKLMAHQTIILSTWAGNVVMICYILTLRSPVYLVWATVAAITGKMLLLAYLAEYWSPGAGDHQSYTQTVALPSYGRLLPYLVCWCAWAGELLTSSNCPFNTASIVGDLVVIIHPGFEWKPYMTFLVDIGFLAGPAIAKLLLKHAPKIRPISPCLNISNGMACAIVFMVMVNRENASFTFIHFLNKSGWTPKS